MIKRNHVYFWVRNKGLSMAPGIQDSSLVLIRLMDRAEWSGLPKEPVCVVVHNGKASIKRVKNRLAKGFIVCMSDNPDKTQYSDFTLQEDEINTLWYAEAKLEFGFPNIHNTYYSRLQRVEDEIENLKHSLQNRNLLR
jgi:phage repressor protein C with HTH and peptisase S24 domain